MAKYTIKFVWKIKAPLEEVWEAVFNTLTWPEWWKSIRSVKETIRGFDSGEGSLRYYKVRGKLPYRIAFCIMTTNTEPHALIEGDIYGDVKGSIEWRFSKADDFTIVHGAWTVYDSKPITYISAFLLWFLFKWNYKSIFRNGAHNLEKHLRVPVKLHYL